MTIGDRRRSQAPFGFAASHHPDAPSVGAVPAATLANAYALSTTGGRFAAQWWRPKPEGDDPDAIAVGTVTSVVDQQVFAADLELPDFVDILRAHLVWSIREPFYSPTVSHRILVNSLPGSESETDSGTAPNWVEEDLILDGWPNLFESELAIDVAGEARPLAVDIRVTISDGPSLAVAFYSLVGVTLWGEVR